MIYKDILKKIRKDYYFLKKQMVDQLFKTGSFKRRNIRGLGRNFKIHSSVLKFFGNCDFSSRENKFLSMWNMFMYMNWKYPNEKDEANIEMLAKKVCNNIKFYEKYIKGKKRHG